MGNFIRNDKNYEDDPLFMKDYSYHLNNFEWLIKVFSERLCKVKLNRHIYSDALINELEKLKIEVEPALIEAVEADRKIREFNKKYGEK